MRESGVMVVPEARFKIRVRVGGEFGAGARVTNRVRARARARAR